MNKRSIRVLEYNKILEQLSEHALTQGAKNKISHLKPFNELNEEELKDTFRYKALRKALKRL